MGDFRSSVRRTLFAPVRTRDRVLRNLTFKGLADVLPRGLMFVFFVVAARLLGSAEFGLFAYGLAIASVLVVAVDFGWNAVVVRRLATSDPSPAVAALFRLKALAALCLAAVAALVFTLAPLRLPGGVAFMLLVATLTFSFQDSMGAVSNGKERFEWEVVVKTLPRFLLLTSAVVFLWVPASLASMSLVFMLTNVAGTAAVAAWFFRRVPEWRRGASGCDVRALAREAVPFGVVAAIWILYVRQDLILLAQFPVPAVEVGYYATASKLIEIGRLAPIVVQMSLVPVFASFAGEPGRVVKSGLKVSAYLVPAGAALAAVFLLGAPLIVSRLFGAEFLPAAQPLQIGGAAMGLMLVNVPIAAAIIALRLEKKLIMTMALAWAVNFALNLFFIPRLSFVGPAWALLASETVLLFANLAVLWGGHARLRRQDAHLPSR